MQVRTILSQNTTDTNSVRAFKSLKERFPTWEAVRTAPEGADGGRLLTPQQSARSSLHPVFTSERLSRALPAGAVEEAIRCGGLADIKTQRLKVWCWCTTLLKVWPVALFYSVRNSNVSTCRRHVAICAIR